MSTIKAGHERGVCIVTPLYNHANYVAQCVESVQRQSFSDWEMVIVDDGSTDDGAAIAESYSKSDPRVKVIRQENQGIGRLKDTYNLAVENTRMAYVAILEGDDYWPANKLQIQIPDFDDDSVVMSWGRAALVKEDGTPYQLGPNKLPPWDARLNVPIGRAAFYMSSHRWQTYTFPVTVMIRRSTLEAIGGFQQRAYTSYLDMPTFMTLAMQGRWAYHHEIVGYWRRHGSSTTTAGYGRILNGAYQWAEEFYSEYGDRVPAALVERDGVDQEWAFFQKDRLLLTGRILASEGKYDEASTYFRKALEFRIGKRTKQMIQAALKLCSLKRSPEGAFRLGRQQDFKEYLKSHSTEPIVSLDIPASEFASRDLVSNVPKDDFWMFHYPADLT